MSKFIEIRKVAHGTSNREHVGVFVGGKECWRSKTYHGSTNGNQHPGPYPEFLREANLIACMLLD